jgi:hypothetical protein
MRLSMALAALVLTTTPFAAAAQNADQPIAGAGAWTLTSAPNSGCYARLSGRGVDTMAMINRSAKLVLAIGRPDWRFGPAQIAAGLKIDGGPVHRVTAIPVGNVALVTIDDDLRKAVLNAKSLTWTLPNGHFTAEVGGLGRAFQAVTPCGLAAARAAQPRN